MITESYQRIYIKTFIRLSSEHTVHFNFIPVCWVTPYVFPFVECKAKQTSAPGKRSFLLHSTHGKNRKSRQKALVSGPSDGCVCKKSTQPL